MSVSASIGSYRVGAGQKPLLIAGPCVIESADLDLSVAESIARLPSLREFQFVFKASYLKDKRRSGTASVAPGCRRGLRVLLTERGTTFGYHDLVVDFRGFARMRAAGTPVIFDVTHSLQRPGGLGNKSGGEPALTAMMARAAAAIPVDGFFIETHPEPAKALSDAASMLPLDQMDGLLAQVPRIVAVSRGSWRMVGRVI